MLKNRKLILALIFALAFILRVWNLGNIPDAIDEDEMAMGYYGYSLLKSGGDEYGHKFPLYFESIGDFKYGLYSYFATLPVAFLGLSPFSARFPAALAGSLTTIALFYLVFEIFKKEKIAYLSALVLALSPLHIHFSRVAYSNILGLLFATLFALFYIRFLKKGKNNFLIWSLISFLAAIFTYQTFRVFLPVLIIFLLIFTFQKLSSKIKTKVLIFSISLILITVLSLLPKEARARTQSTSLLYSSSKLVEDIAEDGLAGTNVFIARAFHNKLVLTGISFVGRYISYFDPKFLFFEASGEVQRHTIPGVGVFYLVELPFVFLSFLYFFKYKKDQFSFLPIFWILTAPLAASLIVEPVSTTRSIPLTLGFSILTAIGIYTFFDLLKFKRIVVILVALVFLGNFFYVAHQYLIHKLYHHPWYSDVGLKEMVEAINLRYYEKYDKIIVPRGHYMPFLFYGRISPQEFLKKAVFLPRTQAQWNRIVSFEKLVFNIPYDCPQAGKEKVLYVCFGTKVPAQAEVLEVIKFKDGLPVMSLIEFKKNLVKTELPERLERSKDVSSEFPDGVIPDDYEYYWPTK